MLIGSDRQRGRGAERTLLSSLLAKGQQGGVMLEGKTEQHRALPAG